MVLWLEDEIRAGTLTMGNMAIGRRVFIWQNDCTNAKMPTIDRIVTRELPKTPKTAVVEIDVICRKSTVNKRTIPR